MGMGINISNSLICYIFSSCLRNVGVGLSQFWHEQMRVLDLHIRWNATGQPVLNPLDCELVFATDSLDDLGRTAQLSDQFGIALNFIHTRIKHHV